MGSSIRFLAFVVEEINRAPHNNSITSFYIDQGRVRGRVVRLGSELQNVLQRHNYPPLINQYLAQMCVIAAALAVDVKSAGVFTLQITNGSVIKFLVVDITQDGEFRACAKWDDAKLEALLESTQGKPSLGQLVGNGYMMFAADLIHAHDRYQAIVELQGPTLAECVHHFFRQSQQIPTALLVYEDVESSAPIIAGGILIQTLPGQGLDNAHTEEEQDDWVTDVSLLSTLAKGELLSPDLSAEGLLRRLFHERGYQVQPLQPLYAGCKCSRTRIEEVIAQFQPSQLEDMFTNDAMTVTCEFCGEHYIFSREQVDTLFDEEV